MEQEKSDNIFDRYQGKYVICRSRIEGINAGYVVKADDTGVILKEARRLWAFSPLNKDVSWYEGASQYGIDENSNISEPVEKLIVEDYSLTVCSDEARDNITKATSHAKD